jgi:hypothetical protein
MNADPIELDEVELIITGTSSGDSAAPGYLIQLRGRPAHSDSERLSPRQPVPFVLPAAELQDALADADSASYGKLLEDAVFANSEIRGAMQRALGRAGAAGLRFRLFADNDEIQRRRWETLHFEGLPLFSGNTCLSRYLSPDKPTPTSPLRPSLRSLIFIASPANVEKTIATDDPAYKAGARPEKQPKLAPIDVNKERAIAEKHLTGESPVGAVSLTAEFIGSPGAGTLEALMTKLDEGFDILYIVCHGAFNAGDPCIYLEGPSGAVQEVKASALISAIETMATPPPRLIVLASCQSAGAGESVPETVASKSLIALGPLLARAGVPAVIAMQGFVTIKTAEIFMSKFFGELRRHGQVDRAAATGRAFACSVARPDYWMPVLYSGSRSGSLFQPYNPGFHEGGHETPWESIAERTRKGTCVPVLGPDSLAPLWGTTQEIAEWLATRYDFPLEEHLSANLPAVAQFIKMDRDDEEFEAGLDHYLTTRLRNPATGRTVWERLSDAARQRRVSTLEDTHKLLATLPYPMYFTACHDRLLEDALADAGRKPHSDFARWNEELCDRSMFPKMDEDYVPSFEKPFVYHLFGDCKVPESMVVTEDEYTRYMLGINSQESVNFTPVFIRRALADNCLLFLGFHFKHPGFQIVLRNTLSRIRDPRKKKMWVGAQIPPEQDRYRRVQAARAYIEKTIGDSLKIYWGTSQDFIDDFARNARRDLPEYFRPKASGAAL